MMEFTSGELWFAFSVTLFAGLSTGIGSALAFFTKKTNTKFLSGALGFSAGVMIYVAFVEILDKAQESLIDYYGATMGQWATILAFFGGIALIAIIDHFVPSDENPHEIRDVTEMKYDSEEAQAARDRSLLRMGMFSAVAIAIHNFPEGLATFIAALQDPTLGVSIAIAIAIHNIPEGIAVSVPIYYATGSKRKAFLFSFLSGLAEPLGAVVGYVFLLRFISDAMFGIVFAVVAGIMIYISLDELLPTAEKYGHHHIGIYGLVLGMAVMAVSIVIL